MNTITKVCNVCKLDKNFDIINFPNKNLQPITLIPAIIILKIRKALSLFLCF